MKIYKRRDDLWAEWGFEDQRSPVISVVGAGGKTSLIRALSANLNDRKYHHDDDPYVAYGFWTLRFSGRPGR